MSAQAAKVEVRNLSKNYGNTRAVSDISFSVGDQQVLGFLGPNGAGKTTVMKIITGFHFPSSGEVFVDGFSVAEQPLEVKKRIGYLPENVPLYGDLTINEYLSFAARARFIPKKDRKEVIEKSMEACAIAEYANRAIDTLSKGYRQRVGLAQAILHDPPILILDEPTTGLDPNQIIEIRSLIKDLGKRKTVILSTHILREVEAMCSRVLIINDGRVAAQGRPEEIALSMKGGDTWELILKGAPENEIREGLYALGDVKSVSVRTADDGNVIAGFFLPAPEKDGAGPGETSSGERVFDWAVARNMKILEMNREKFSIEDIFVKLTSDDAKSREESDK